MKLRFLISVADNDRNYEGGEVYEVASAARAEHFLTHGIAQAVADAPSAAVVPEEAERATLPKAQKRAP
jgi:hypothetical protein